MARGRDNVVALFSRRDDGDEATISVDTASPGPSRSRLIPLALITVLSALYAGTGGYWLVTGAPPSFLVPASKRALLDIPPRPGPESPQSALLQPPGAVKPAAEPPPDAAVAEPAAVAPPPDSPAPAPAPKPAAEPAVPQVPGGPSPAPQLAALPPPKAVPPLPDAPIVELVRMTPSGPLPVTAADGREPWRAYARPFSDATGRARVAVVVSGLGLGKAVTEAAITRLPAEVTLAFSPYSRELGTWLKRARAAGHEVMIELPLETERFPEADPGPLALTGGLPDAKLKERLETVMTKGAGYTGLLAVGRSPFAGTDQMHAVLEDLRKRGLLYAASVPLPEDPRLQPAFAATSVTLDGRPYRAAIDARLGQALDAARQRGQVVAVGQALPVTIERLAQWLNTLGDKGVVLAPVSAVAKPPATITAAP